MARQMVQKSVDELNAPLGRKKKSAKKSAKDAAPFSLKTETWPFGRLMALALLLLVGGIAARLILVDDPEGGRPVSEIAITSERDANQVAGEIGNSQTQVSLTVGDQFPASDLPADPERPIADIDVADRTLNNFGAYPQLLEQTQHGPVPHIGVNGERPFDAYSRASIGPAAANGRPLIAVIVTGLGLNESSSIDAISKLPDNVTLAFAPYGDGLTHVTATAQSEGHEMWLEVPMEPFDYPESDPGPHTLLVNQPVRSNLDKLIWLLARFGGYAGIINNQGARFTSTAGDFSPIMEEIGTRGLGYIDDGSSNRSLAPQLAGANRVPFARAGVQLDTNPSRAAILVELDRLTEQAEANGSAVGVISALPVSIDTLASWASDLEDQGILLVPASALMQGES